jgi:aryl-alcohol dehydrogenase-like predicted oxidoreductase
VAVRSGQRRDCTPIREQLEALAELVRKARSAHIGVSNEHPWGIMQFTRLADELGLPRIVSTQNAYSLLNRTFETGWPKSAIANRSACSPIHRSPSAT